MPGDYIPSTDAGFLAWSQNFNNQATLAPTAVGLTAPQAVAYDAAFLDYDTWMITVGDPNLRTPAAIVAKDVSKAALLLLSRQYAAIIQAFPGTSDAERTLFGLTIRDTGRTPYPTPTAEPELAVQKLLPLQIKLRLKQVGSLLSPYPLGAPLCEIWYKTGDVAPVDLSGCSYAGDASSRFFMHDVPGAMGGDKIHYIARYKTLTGLFGPLSATLSTTVPY